MAASDNLLAPIVLVTGASRGIGRATCLTMAEAGFRVAMFSRNLAELRTLQNEIESRFSIQTLGLAVDITAPQAVETGIDAIETQLGPIEILVNNAGCFEGYPFESFPTPAWHRVFDVNVHGVFFCSRALFARWKTQKRSGSIVNIASLGGIRGIEKFPGTTAYVASKAAVIAMTEAMAVEGKAYNIRVNGIAPGAVETDMLRQAAPHLKTETQPGDIAKTILHFADKRRSGHISGSTLEVFSNG